MKFKVENKVNDSGVYDDYIGDFIFADDEKQAANIAIDYLSEMAEDSNLESIADYDQETITIFLPDGTEEIHHSFIAILMNE